jgi:hypothetical protein
MSFQTSDRFRIRHMCLLLLAASYCAACGATRQQYVSAVKQDRGSGFTGVEVRIGSLQYATDEFVPRGWFAAQPIPVVLSSLTDDPVLVDWDRSALVSPSGETLRIIHSGVSLADARAGNYRTYQKQSLIAPHAKLTEIMVPVPWLETIGYKSYILFEPVPAAHFKALFSFDVGGRSFTSNTPFTIETGQLVNPG